MEAPRTTPRILDRVRRRGPDAVWIPSDFQDLGGRRAIDAALHRLHRAGEIRRLAHGLYDRPARRARFGPVPPSVDVIAAAIARRTGSRVQIAGEGALHVLGLSTQVPASATYLTDGPSRRLAVLGLRIAFRHVTARRLAGAGTVAGTVMEALRVLGPEAADAPVLDHLRRTLSDVDLRHLRRLAPSATEAQRRVLAQLLRAD